MLLSLLPTLSFQGVYFIDHLYYIVILYSIHILEFILVTASCQNVLCSYDGIGRHARLKTLSYNWVLVQVQVWVIKSLCVMFHSCYIIFVPTTSLACFFGVRILVLKRQPIKSTFFLIKVVFFKCYNVMKFYLFFHDYVYSFIFFTSFILSAFIL